MNNESEQSDVKRIGAAPAFPRDAGFDFEGQRVVSASPGMTMREEIAARIMAGFAANPTLVEAASIVAERGELQEALRGIAAQRAVEWADALLARLAK